MGAAGQSFSALRHRNFRLLWYGQVVSMTGSMMQNAAILWHVTLLVPENQKNAALGLVGLVKLVPIIVFSLLSGVVADALDRRRLMIWTQVVMTGIALALWAITAHGLDVVWPLYLLTALSSGAGAFDGPARQALVPALVPEKDFPNAIALNTTLFQIAAVLGPALAGQMIAHVAIEWVYCANALSFLAVLWALLAMRDVPVRAAAARAPITLRSLGEGLRYVFREPLMRSSMLLDFFATFFASASALLPVFAQDVLKVGPRGYGLLAAAPAFGAVAASVVLVRFSDAIVRRGSVLLWAVAAYGCATVAFGLSTSFWLTFGCLALTGAADTVSMILRNIIRQLGTPDALRGRMTGVNMVFFMGGPQLGEFEAGAVAHAFGPVVSVVSGGIGCLIATAAIAWREPVLRRYRRP